MSYSQTFKKIFTPIFTPIAAAILVTQLTGCFPLAATGFAVGTLSASDRRTVGAQTEDQGINLKAESRIASQLPNAHINVSAYNRKVLLTGEAPDEADKKKAAEIAKGVENTADVLNEIDVMGNSSLTSRSSDSIITTKVKASFVEDKILLSNSFKVTTERGVVYLMGLVTKREGDRATEIARGVSGVSKVVRVFEYISEEEAQKAVLKPTENK